MDQTRDVLARIDADAERSLAELKDFLRIPSISTDPAHRDDVRRAASFVADQLRGAGLTTELIETEGHPLAYGEWLGAPGKPTVLFYGHYDVQPVDPIELWRSPPFEPVEENGFLVCRGATDDKGQAFTHVKAVAAILATRGALPVNVKFLVEGEEECGGQGIEKFVRADGGQRLAADAVVISDSHMYADGQPSILYGLKGLVYLQMKVVGPNQDLHSGQFGGGVTNPLNALCHIIDRLRDSHTGKVLIPGFYDDVVPLADWERQEFAALPFDEAAHCRALGISETFGEEGYTYQERVWGRPTCDVNGIFGGYEGKGAKTVIASWGGAKVSMRLVPNQTPATIGRLFNEYVQSIAPPGVTVTVEDVQGGPPTVVDVRGPIADAALDALEDVFGRRPVRVRDGGSIPIVSTFAEVLRSPVLLIGFGLPDDGLHSPNERFRIANFFDGIRTVAVFLDRLGSVAI